MAFGNRYADLPASCFQAVEALLREVLIAPPDPQTLDALIAATVASHVPDAGERERDLVKHLVILALNNVGKDMTQPGSSLAMGYGPDKVQLPIVVETGYWVGCAVLDDWDAVAGLTHWIPGQALREELAARTRERLGLPEDHVSVLPMALSLTDARTGLFGSRFARVTASGMLGDKDERRVDEWRQIIQTRQHFQVWQLPGGRLGVPFTLPVAVASLVVHDYWWPPEAGEDWDDAFARLLLDDLRSQRIAISRLQMVSAEPFAQEALTEPIEDIVRVLEEQGGRQTPMQSREAVGRNDPCPCGSGKKYKKCCGG